MSYELPNLGYDFSSLEPYIDAKTMEIHHGKHHNAYVTNLNKAVEATEYQGKDLLQLMGMIDSSTPPAIRNNGGGHYNHTFFWSLLSREGAKSPSGKLAEKIEEDLEGFEAFKKKFAQAAATRFGSGWAWLCVRSDGSLEVCSTPNQDNPLMKLAESPGTPVLGLDVWEHAYYLHYQNRRPDYIAAFWNVVNWEVVNSRYQEIIS